MFAIVAPGAHCLARKTCPRLIADYVPRTAEPRGRTPLVSHKHVTALQHQVGLQMRRVPQQLLAATSRRLLLGGLGREGRLLKLRIGVAERVGRGTPKLG